MTAPRLRWKQWYGASCVTWGLLASAALAAPAVANPTEDRIISGTVMGGVLGGALARGVRQDARSLDLVPRGSWILDAFAYLAAEGAIAYSPEEFEGWRPWTRGELATVLEAGDAPGIAPPVPRSGNDRWEPLERPPGAPPLDREHLPESAIVLPGGQILVPRPPTQPHRLPLWNSRVRLLAWELRYELGSAGARPPPAPRNASMIFGAYGRAQLSDAKGLLRPSLTGSADLLGSVGSLRYTAAVSSLNPSGFLQPFHLVGLSGYGAVMGAAPALTYGSDARFLRTVSRAAVSDTFAGWGLEVGRDWLEWGQAYSGPMALSDSSGPLDLFLVKKEFELGRFGTVRFEQFDACDPQPTIGNRWVIGRRLEKTLAGGLEMSYGEILVSRGQPLPYYQVLPFYPAKLIDKHTGNTGNVDVNSHNDVDLQIAYQGSRARYYADALIDDILFPIPFSAQVNTPRKIGLLLGSSIIHPVPGIENLILEGVYTDAHAGGNDTYTPNGRPELAYARYGEMIGSPIGPGSSGIVLRADLTPLGRWRLFFQGTVEQHHRESPNPDREIAGWIGALRSLNHRTSLGVTLRPYSIHDENAIAGADETRLDGEAYVSTRF